MILIKRYPNRKLYNTVAKQYITLDGIADLVRSGAEVQVIDHATGEDLTALTLTQIILDQEKRRSGVMTNSFLTGLIRAGGDRLSAIQRSLPSPITIWKQIDEEINRRIQSLEQQGEITEKDAKTLIEKLARQNLRRISGSNTISESDMEEYLNRQAIPTKEDIQKLNDQLEILNRKIEEMANEKSNH